MRGQLFEYAILFHPKTPASELLNQLQDPEIETPKSEIIVKPSQVVAESIDHARTFAATQLPQSFNERLDQVEILVRPFFPQQTVHSVNSYQSDRTRY